MPKTPKNDVTTNTKPKKTGFVFYEKRSSILECSVSQRQRVCKEIEVAFQTSQWVCVTIQSKFDGCSCRSKKTARLVEKLWLCSVTAPVSSSHPIVAEMELDGHMVADTMLWESARFLNNIFFSKKV